MLYSNVLACVVRCYKLHKPLMKTEILYLPVLRSQVGPSYPCAHWHAKELPDGEQVAPFRQGLLSQGPGKDIS